MNLNVVILAAGQGKRMRSELPKVLHTLAGRPLLSHVIDAARALKPSCICIVHGHGGQQVVSAIHGDDLQFVEQTQQLGTGHAVRQALPHLKGKRDILVLYGDVPLLGHQTLAMLAKSKGDRLRILTATLTDPQGYGRIVRDASGAIRGIVEEKDATPEQRRIAEINTGVMLLPGTRATRWLARLSNRNAQREYYLTDTVKFALEDKVAIESCSPKQGWEILGVNDKRQLAQLERIAQVQIAERLLREGTTLADPARIDIRGTLVCGRDVFIDVGCIFEGEVELGNDVTIGAHCVIRNARVGSGTKIAPFSAIDEARLGSNCLIGPYARIRPGTELDRDVHVGNFVEVKASSIKRGSKANHLAYIGDSSIGRNVNVGAGAITCNYDGAHKHKTIIEDDVFIGSDTQLVAPVIVRRGATLGAGSTITREAPAGQLTLSRVNQISVKGWRRPSKDKSGR